MDSIRFIASHCYVGMTMKDGVEVSYEVELKPGRSASARATGLAGGPAAPSCDDGSCCIPDFTTS
jgi:hypothetical protein